MPDAHQSELWLNFRNVFKGCSVIDNMPVKLTCFGGASVERARGPISEHESGHDELHDNGDCRSGSDPQRVT